MQTIVASQLQVDRATAEYLKNHAIYIQWPLVDETGSPTGKFEYRLRVEYPVGSAPAAGAVTRLISDGNPKYSWGVRMSPRRGKAIAHYEINGSFDLFEHHIAPHCKATLILAPQQRAALYKQLQDTHAALMQEADGKTRFTDEEMLAMEKKLEGKYPLVTNFFYGAADDSAYIEKPFEVWNAMLFLDNALKDIYQGRTSALQMAPSRALPYRG